MDTLQQESMGSFNGSTTKDNINQEHHKQALCVKYRKGAKTILNYQLFRWVISDKIDRSFGYYVKVVEVITTKTPPVEVNRTVRMNSHRIHCQASSIMV